MVAASSRVVSRFALLALPVALLVAGAAGSPLGHRCRSHPLIGHAEPADSDPSALAPFATDPVAVLPGPALARSTELSLAVSEPGPAARRAPATAVLAVAPKTSPPACA